LAIDYGAKRTGLAVCDPTETIVSPLAVISSQKELLKKIIGAVETENAEAIVIGMPLNMDDSVGPQATIVQQFAERLKGSIEIPIYFQDERLSSFSAGEKLASADFSRQKRKKRLDAIAAAEILQAFLERKKH